LTVSVVIAVHDGERFLARALASVLGQTRPPDEVIVVDDGSRDASAALAEGRAGITCLRRPHEGQAAALNHGIASSTGSVLAFLDADDEWLANKLELQLKSLAADERLAMVFGHAESWMENGAGGFRARSPILPARLPSALLVRRRAFLQAGPFDRRLGLGMPIEWYARARDAGLSELVLPDTVYRRWIHGANMGIARAAHRHEYTAALKCVLDRRRARQRPAK
jgi:glycosyltransferase involved in cell wall biosynthesis